MLRDDPGSYDANRMLATLYLSQHRFREAIRVAERSRDERPYDPVNYGVIGDAHVELGDYDEAFDGLRSDDGAPAERGVVRAGRVRARAAGGPRPARIEAMKLAAERDEPDRSRRAGVDARAGWRSLPAARQGSRGEGGVRRGVAGVSRASVRGDGLRQRDRRRRRSRPARSTCCGDLRETSPTPGSRVTDSAICCGVSAATTRRSGSTRSRRRAGAATRRAEEPGAVPRRSRPQIDEAVTIAGGRGRASTRHLHRRCAGVGVLQGGARR